MKVEDWLSLSLFSLATQNCHLFHCHRELFVIDIKLTANNHLTDEERTADAAWCKMLTAL